VYSKNQKPMLGVLKSLALETIFFLKPHATKTFAELMKISLNPGYGKSLIIASI